MISAEGHGFRIPPLRFGAGAHREILAAAREHGDRILLVTDAHCRRIPEVNEIATELLGAGGAVFDEIPGEPTSDDVARGVAAWRDSEAEVVVGIGGGAVLDTAKAIAAMARHRGTILDYVGRDRLTHDRLPLLLAPTTAGTGSEVTRYIAVGDAATGAKLLVTDWRFLPDLASVDPRLVLGAPPRVTASSGVDALTHGIEAYVSRRHQPTADLFALRGIELIARGLRGAFARGTDLEARALTALGATYTGVAFSNSSVALVHGMSRPLGAYFHIPHGLANAMLLPSITAWSLPGDPGRYDDVGRALGLRSGEEIPHYLEALSTDLGIPRLGEAVDPARLTAVAPRMADAAIASGSPANNPRGATPDEIVDLYRQCLQVV